MVTGIISHPEGPSRAFLHDGTRLIDLGDFGGASSQGFGINRCGHVAGWPLGPVSDIPQAFKYDGTLRNLGTPGRFSQAHALNDCDKIAGGASFGGPNHALLHDGVRSIAAALNDAGQVAGTSDNAQGKARAFRYSGGVMQDLGTLSGGDSSEAFEINEPVKGREHGLQQFSRMPGPRSATVKVSVPSASAAIDTSAAPA